ncbi:MAG: response regulator [Pseudomonadota bacterium]|nr:response regulator [Pseudomonadota bacterium]
MTNRLALVVDDSKTARITLKRMLDKQGLEVDTLESAQEALDYLIEKTPDVIFMDHMMPGMDGFEAVESIKSNPDTATIPIMMYTSKGGDLYVSQARALGAVGILPKQVKPAELFEVLNNLGLVKDRREKTTTAERNYVLMDTAPEINASANGEGMQEIARKAAESVGDNRELHGYFNELLEDKHHELKQDIHDLRQTLNRLSGTGTGSTAPASTARSPGWFGLLVVLLLMMPPLLWLYKLNHETRLKLDDTMASLQTTRQAQQRTARADSPQASEQSPELPDTGAEQTRDQSGPLFNTIGWAVNLGSPYDVDEEAFGNRRLAIVYELISRLRELGFKGLVQLDSHLGEYCLTGNDVDGYTPAPADLAVSECVAYGHPLQQLPLLGERQSIAFANFMATSPLVNGSDISIEVIPHQYSQPLLEYPSRNSDIKALEWNRIAARNNRVDVTLIPVE